MSDDWLSTDETIPLVPAVVDLPVAGPVRAVMVKDAWGRLTNKQRLFLTTLRQNGFNAKAAGRALEIVGGPVRESHVRWMHDADYVMVFRAWRAWAAGEVRDPDGLVLRHDGIVEEALTPKPILHQGAPTGFEEVELGVAARANETLMKSVGLLKDKEIEINVGIAVGPPTLNIQVLPVPPSKIVRRENVAIDAQFTEVPTDDEWPT